MRFLLATLALGAAVAIGMAGSEADAVAPAERSLAPSPAAGPAPAVIESSKAHIPDIEAELLVSGLDRPTFAVPTPDGRLFVTEKAGTIRVVADDEVLPDPLLDLDPVVPDHRPERGLLAIALHPEFEANGRFYVHLTDVWGDSRLVEYTLSADDPNVADPESARLVLAVEQPGEFHNGGMLQFGPDGFLYVAMGDGDFGESDRNAAVRSNLLGSILRIDVDRGDPYAVPADNPFVGTPDAAEVWFTGMRNPWRFFIDAPSRSIVVGDVGQFDWEEIQVLPLDAPGLDLGWPTLEGRHCYQADECDSDGYVLPDVVYSHRTGCAMVAGPVYRGTTVPELTEMIVYADYCTGRVSAYALHDGDVGRNLELIDPGTYGPILSLAVDGNGEVLLLTETGEIRRLRSSNR